MTEIGRIIHGDTIHGIKNLFANSYVHNMKNFYFYKKIEFKKRIILLSKIANDLSKKCKIICYSDLEDDRVVYSFIAYDVSEKGVLTVYFAYTKFPFRGYGFVSKLLNYLEKETESCQHAVPKRLDAYHIWKNYKQIQPYYPQI